MENKRMTSKERVYTALKHEKPDRVPRFIWLGNGTTAALCSKYNLKPLELEFKLGNDILQTWLSINREMARDIPDGGTFVDEWGISWKRDGWHNMVIKHPLAGLDASAIKAYPFPDPHSRDRYEILSGLIQNYGKTHFIGADISGSLFEPAYHLRGMEDFLADLMEGDETADIILGKLEDFTTSVAIEALKMGVDWIWLGDDLGTQNSMIMSPDLWREKIKPRLQRIINAIRLAKPDITIAYHSCGSIRPIVPDLAEIGINVLNPVQESASGMSQTEIKQEFGDRLSLMCGLDTQSFLITATPKEIKEAVADKIKTLGSSGGLIFAASHHIQHDTPYENIETFFESLDNG